MSHAFPDLKVTLTADPNTIYLDPFHLIQPLTIKFTLAVDNGSRSDFNAQARSVTLSQNGETVAFAHKFATTVVENIKVAAGHKADSLVYLNVDDVHRLNRGTAEAEAEFTPTGDKTKISMTVIQLAQVEVQVYSFSGDNTQPVGAAAGAGVSLKIGGMTFGVTDAQGKATLIFSSDVTLIEAERFPGEQGSASVQLQSTVKNSVTIVLDDGKEVYGDAKIRADQISQLLLPSDFANFKMRFVACDEKTVKLDTVDRVELFDSIGQSAGLLTELFSITEDGGIGVTAPDQIRALLAPLSGKLSIEVQGVAAQGLVYEDQTFFYLGVTAIVGNLAAPSSFPGLNTGCILVTGRILNTDVVVSTVSTPSGNFTFPKLPADDLVLEISSQTFQNDRYYYGKDVFSISSYSASLKILMTSAQDLLEGHLKSRDTAHLATPLKASAPYPIGLQLSPQGPRQSAMLTVPQGIQIITLNCGVGCVPGVWAAWGVSVLAGSAGIELFSITKNVTKQDAVNCYASGICDSAIAIVGLDVSEYTKSGPADVVLSAFITNDSTAGLLATLAPSGELTINFASILPEIAVAGSYLSVPRLGKVNTFERHFALAVTKPHATSIKDVKVELLAAASDALVFDGAPGEDVQLRSDGTIYVLGTFKRNARCTVNSTPPPTDTVDYRFTINAVDTEGKILTATYTLPGGTPLWRAPDGLSRYGFRDCGGDDWCSKGAYDWIVANKSLLKAIDDISGEHGRNIGHRGHDKGTDIDMYHFYLFPGADPKIAKSNYTQLLARVFDLPKMFSSNPNDAGVGLAANAQVTAWVNQTRAGIDNLASLSSVKLLFYIDGPSNAALPKHWGSTLLRTGQIAVSGKPIDLNLGLWNNSKYRPDINHYSHVHISLDPKHLS